MEALTAVVGRSLGLVVAVIGGALLAAKIMRRNSEPMETLSRRD
jgi:uncharacterized protein YneF (UPF0154 family)